jgi:hypothetical protein
MTLTETLHAGGFVVSEANGFRSREQGTIALSQTLVAGQVLGATAVIAGVTSSASADASNTSGSGAITLDVTTPVAAGAKNGAYRAVCIEPAANGGTFAVFDPDGIELGKVAVAGTFDNQIKFVIADATDFVAGDAFTILVGIEPSDKNYAALDLAAATGLQHAAAILFAAITTDGSTKKPATLITRDAEVRLADLTFPGSITAAQQAAVLAELAALGIIAR